MDLQKLFNSCEILLMQMKEDGYCEDYIKNVRFEINWIAQSKAASMHFVPRTVRRTIKNRQKSRVITRADLSQTVALHNPPAV